MQLADGHIVKCEFRGHITLNLHTTKGKTVKLTLEGVLVVPGLSRRLFSFATFAAEEHATFLDPKGLHLLLGYHKNPKQYDKITLPLPFIHQEYPSFQHSANVISNTRRP